MENLQNLRFCPWISDKFSLKTYFDEYKEVVDEIFREREHGTPIPFEKFIKDCQSLMNQEEKDSDLFSRDGQFNDIGMFDIEQLEKDCSIDLLSVEDELKPETIPKGPNRLLSQLTTYYAGNFSDGVIPEGKSEKLKTLQYQAEELIKRATVSDYSKLRYRMLKYHNTIRVLIDEKNVAIPIKASKQCLEDIVLNVRVQRPFHRRTHYKKASNRYPSHSQELLLLGSQKISDLRDAINCINDLAVHQDLSDLPEMYRLSRLPNGATQFPSSFIYINGTFYTDFRNPMCEDHSKEIREWAKKYPEIGELLVADMSKATFQELEIRLGYPYVYIHQGNCEHLVTFTDVRMHHIEDVGDASKYPVSRGKALKYSVTCYACGLHVANWIIQGDTRIPTPNAHLCDRCLKYFCYDVNFKKIMDIKVFPFFNEFQSEQKEFLATSKLDIPEATAKSDSKQIKKRYTKKQNARGRKRKGAR